MTWRKLYICLLLFCSASANSSAQHSIARQWNETLLEAIRNDFARPTVHARNLFHTSIAMYDLWAVYDSKAEPFLLGKTVGEYTNVFDGISAPNDIEAARSEAISYAAYRLLKHRFQNSPSTNTDSLLNELFINLGYDSLYVDTDYSSGSPAALGNFMAQSLIEFGQQDHSNEVNDYQNQFYEPINTSTNPIFFGVRPLTDPNRWQPLNFDVFIDQSGHAVPGGTPDFLSPEWGQVTPFALSPNDLSIHERGGNDYWVYHDPGAPPLIDTTGALQTEDYQWNFSLVSIWASHLDPADSVMIDISPASIGNLPELPIHMDSLRSFYNLFDGGDTSQGHEVNPITGQAYEPQIVPRGDYTRVLAEFWADGPDSETPPGHWFTILNYVNDHPLLEKRFQGEGELLNDLEWDVKSYFALAGALHDAAVAAWGIKGWYDYLRPISAIRSMAKRGQSTDTTLANYHPAGLPLIEGFIEIVDEDDPLSRGGNFHVGEIKIYSWQGHGHTEIDDPETETAGVGWLLAEDWWPYQRPTFVTPPFAGYISGHSTFSRAAAEVLTMLTGDPFFPGGMGEFLCKKNEFLVFEEGPSQDITLQWATYRDASDQTSLSRIWGGIHPPADDIPGRHIGKKIGIAAFNLAEEYFEGINTSVKYTEQSDAIKAYPNPIPLDGNLSLEFYSSPSRPPSSVRDRFGKLQIEWYDLLGQKISSIEKESTGNRLDISLTELASNHQLSPGIYLLKILGNGFSVSKKIFIVQSK